MLESSGDQLQWPWGARQVLEQESGRFSTRSKLHTFPVCRKCLLHGMGVRPSLVMAPQCPTPSPAPPSACSRGSGTATCHFPTTCLAHQLSESELPGPRPQAWSRPGVAPAQQWVRTTRVRAWGWWTRTRARQGPAGGMEGTPCRTQACHPELGRPSSVLRSQCPGHSLSLPPAVRGFLLYNSATFLSPLGHMDTLSSYTCTVHNTDTILPLMAAPVPSIPLSPCTPDTLDP